MQKIEQDDNGKQGKFTLYEHGEKAGELNYVWEDENKLVIEHTEVDPKFSGKGFGKDLVMKAVEFARDKNIKIKPVCSYAKRVFEKDETISDVLSV